MPTLLQLRRQPGCALARPSQRRLRIAACHRVNQFVQRSSQSRSFCVSVLDAAEIRSVRQTLFAGQRNVLFCTPRQVGAGLDHGHRRTAGLTPPARSHWQRRYCPVWARVRCIWRTAAFSERRCGNWLDQRQRITVSLDHGRRSSFGLFRIRSAPISANGRRIWPADGALRCPRIDARSRAAKRGGSGPVIFSPRRTRIPPQDGRLRRYSPLRTGRTSIRRCWRRSSTSGSPPANRRNQRGVKRKMSNYSLRRHPDR